MRAKRRPPEEKEKFAGRYRRSSGMPGSGHRCIIHGVGSRHARNQPVLLCGFLLTRALRMPVTYRLRDRFGSCFRDPATRATKISRAATLLPGLISNDNDMTQIPRDARAHTDVFGFAVYIDARVSTNSMHCRIQPMHSACWNQNFSNGKYQIY